MSRVKRGNVARKRRKKVLKLAKGFRGSHSRLFRTANQQVMKALRNAYRDRRKRKRDFRRPWITRISHAKRHAGILVQPEGSDDRCLGNVGGVHRDLMVLSGVFI